MNRLILGLTGRAGSGKDTLADYLCSDHGFTKLAFADKLREEVAHAWGIDSTLLTSRETKEIPSPALALSGCIDSRFKLAMHALLIGDATGKEADERWALECIQPRSPRWIMQRWGTDYRRAWMGASYWRDALRHRLAETAGDVVITDVRFDDEARLIADLGGEVWHITRPNLAPVESHASERGIVTDLIHRTIDNAGTLVHLHHSGELLLAYVKHTREKAA